ncbi:hypothetical protein FJP62_11520 [Pantoea vagans]|nr:hypothetical protein FJP62_11520 [Pantoea vagans]
MLDLLKWAKDHDVRIFDARLSRLLYTDEDEEDIIGSESQTKDTNKPLALKACLNDFIRQFNLLMNKNPHLKGIKVVDIMLIFDST